MRPVYIIAIIFILVTSAPQFAAASHRTATWNVIFSGDNNRDVGDVSADDTHFNTGWISASVVTASLPHACSYLYSREAYIRLLWDSNGDLYLDDEDAQMFANSLLCASTGHFNDHTWVQVGTPLRTSYIAANVLYEARYNGGCIYCHEWNPKVYDCYLCGNAKIPTQRLAVQQESPALAWNLPGP